MRQPTDACLAALALAGLRAEPSALRLNTYLVASVATEERPATFMGEMSEREIWAWLERHKGSPAPGSAKEER